MSDRYQRLTAPELPRALQYGNVACRDADPDDFFPLSGQTEKAPSVQRALAACDLCPHTEECLRWALETNQIYGVWGGTTAAQREGMTA
jgi:WhiB family transcriptional regulator, redox-sensing transcriptional regulator